MVKFVPFSFAMREFMFTFAIVMLTRLFFSVWLAMVAVATCAQEVVQDEKTLDEEAVDATPSLDPMLKLGRVLDNGDSIQYVEVNPIYVYPKPVFKNAKQRQAYNRLVANVKKVLPIAKEVNVIIQETYEYLQTLPNKKAKDEHMKYVEKSIKKEYTPRMKKLSYQQGKLLIKLIYRECNSSSYQLIQAFLGPVRAGFYQAFAWAFGASLTKKYDPEGVDRLTERVVLQVEAGQI